MKKILWFNWRCWLNPAMGGAEVFTREVAKRWVQSGHEVTLFTSTFPGCKKEEIVDGVKIIRAGGRFSVYLQARQFYAKRFSHEGFEIVIDEINTIPFLTPRFVNHGEKIFALIHQLAREYWFYEMPFPINYLGYYILEDSLLRQYIDVPTVTVSDSTFMDLTNSDFKSITIVPEGLNFIPLSSISEKESKPIVIYAGRLKRTKRTDHAINAFKIVKAKVPEAELWVIGDGPFRSELENMAGEGVRFFGRLSNSERQDLIKRSWVLVNPGIREGWGLNIIEANALGVPAVAYDVPGLRDSVKKGETGLLANAGDESVLAANLINILTDDKLRHQLSINALECSRQFNWSKTAEKFMDIL